MARRSLTLISREDFFIATPAPVDVQRIVVLRIILICSLVVGCTAPTTPDPGAALQREVLVAFDRSVARPALEQFVTDALALDGAVGRWSSAPSTSEALALGEARAAFEKAFLSWQRLEVMQLGPLGAATRVTFGEGLRDEVYSWPAANLCRVDASLVTWTEPTDASFDTALVTSKGLLVLEHLLWPKGDTNECPAAATINTDGSWTALAMTPELTRRRKVYAAGAARHVERTARRVRDAWATYAEKLTAAGTRGSSWRTTKDALDDLFAGLFYVDRVAKDFKLGAPAGLTMACMAASCPELAESQRARLSAKALEQNLTTARSVLTGSADPASTEKGFDDLLDDRNASALKTDLLAALDAAIAGAKSLPGPVSEVATSSVSTLQAEHAAVKAFCDLLKTQFVTTLSLKVPLEGAGDND